MRAFQWIRELAQLPRLAGSGAEARAAERLEGWLRELGVDEVTRLPAASRPRPGLVLAAHLGLAALGVALGGPLGAALAVLAAVSLRREEADRPLLSRWLPAPASLAVVGRAGAREPAQRVVLHAPLDAPQAGWLFSAGAPAWLRRQPLFGTGAWPRGLVLAAAALGVAAALGADGPLVAAAQTALFVGLALGAGLALEWGFAAPSPGANAHASGVASMLTCAEQLLAQLPEDTELWMVAAGAAEVGGCGLAAFCREHPGWPPHASYFVGFEATGGGSLHWRRAAHGNAPPLLAELARRVAASGAFGEVAPARWDAPGPGAAPGSRVHPSLSIVALEPDGRPRAERRRDDRPAALDMETVVRAADFGAAVAYVALRGEAGPIALV